MIGRLRLLLLAILGVGLCLPAPVAAGATRPATKARPGAKAQSSARTTSRKAASSRPKVRPPSPPPPPLLVSATRSLADTAAVRVNDLPLDTRFAFFVVTGQEIKLDASFPGGPAQRWEGDGRFVAGSHGRRLTWRAPDAAGPAILVLKTADPDRGWVERTRLNIQVMVPARQLAQGFLRGYRIGRYPAPRVGLPIDYAPPRAFVRVPAAGSGTPVSPRFFLEDFACRQRHAGDSFLVLQPRLLPFLEAITDRVEALGFVARAPEGAPAGARLAPTTGGEPPPTGAFRRPVTVMSGYRTPAYNRSLGNVRRSRHQYGDAADIYVDSDGDGMMDDLNADGVVSGEDARTLAGWIDEIWSRPEFAGCPGGLGIYNGAGDHGPFVHVDLRGWRARWSSRGLDWDEAEPPAGGIE